eukprot:Platyproteum_vivax@DN2894_c0_g1_i1.p1
MLIKCWQTHPLQFSKNKMLEVVPSLEQYIKCEGEEVLMVQEDSSYDWEAFLQLVELCHTSKRHANMGETSVSFEMFKSWYQLLGVCKIAKKYDANCVMQMLEGMPVELLENDYFAYSEKILFKIGELNCLIKPQWTESCLTKMIDKFKANNELDLFFDYIPTFRDCCHLRICLTLAKNSFPGVSFPWDEKYVRDSLCEVLDSNRVR